MAAKDQHMISDKELARYFAGEASSQEQQRVEKWASLTEENQDTFLKLKATWAETGLIKPGIDRKEYPSFNVDAAWANVQSRKELRIKDQSRGSGASLTWLLRVAATVVLLVGFGWWLVDNYRPDQLTELVATNQILSDTLPDGSHVILNEGSRLIVPVAFEGNRKVKLTGEAYFDVQHNPEDPFTVKVDEVSVRVLGTSFNVKASVDQVRVTVDTGKVLFSGKSGEVTLLAGMTGIYNKTSQKFTSTNDQAVSDHNFWRTGTMAFSSATLPEVVKALNHAYHANISIGDEKITDCKISVAFQDENLEEILEIISATLNLQVDTTGQAITIRGDGC